MDERQHDAENDPIAASVKRAGDLVVVGDPAAMRREVQAVSDRRRNRRRVAVGGALGVTALVAGLGVVSVIGDDSTDDRLVSSPADQPEVDDAVTTDPPAPAAEPGDDLASTAPPSTVLTPSPPRETAPELGVGGTGTVAVRPATSVEAVVDAGVARQGVASVEVFAWNDGFLAVRRTSQQALPPELPDEISSQFPQEVLDLFPDGLPPTLDEAMAILDDADLLEVVTEIVLSNQDVNEAIYDEQPDIVTTVRFSPDGVEWNDVEFDFPEFENGFPLRQLTVGDRFVVAADAAYESPDAGKYVDIHVSTDLVNWDVKRVVLPEPEPQRGIQYYVQLEGFAANDAGWVASLSRYSDFAIDDILPEGILDEAGGGRDYGYDDDGIYVQEFDENGEPGERLDFSWAELGFDAPPPLDSPGTRVAIAAAWGSEPIATESETDQFGSRLAPFGGGFVEYGRALRLSSDGSEWIEVPLPVSGWISWVLDTPDGLLVSMSGDDGTATVYLLDAAALTWTPVDLPGVPERAQESGPSAYGAVVLVDWNEPTYIQPAVVELQVEADGYTLTMSIDAGSNNGAAQYVVVDTATGEPVAGEQTDSFDGYDAFENVRSVPGAIEVDLPDSDGLAIEFPQSAIVYTELDEFGEVVQQPGGSDEAVQQMPDHWVVAPVDGELLVEPVVTDSGWVVGAAVQSDTVVVALGDGTFVRFTAG